MDLLRLPVVLACLFTATALAGCSGGSDDGGSSSTACSGTVNETTSPIRTKSAVIACSNASGAGTDQKTVTGCSSATSRSAIYSNGVEDGSVTITVTDGAGDVVLQETLRPGGEDGQELGLEGDRFTVKGVRSSTFAGDYSLTATCTFYP